MEVIPVAFDSFGARSMCTYIETADVRVIIDPSVALGPKRYSLPPHPIEFERERKLWNRIKEFVAKADVTIITHYHYDHHNPEEPEIFRNKKLLIKHPREKINLSQKNRSAYFIKQLGDFPESVEYADGKRFEFGDTVVTISPPVFHGTSDKLGYVLEVCVDDGKKFIFSSDVEGPSLAHQIEFMIESNPDIIFIDGPMTYMLGYRYSQKSFYESLNNLRKIIEVTDVKEIIVDHHLTRDLKWRERLETVFSAGIEHGVKVLSAAEFGNIDEDMLEARRKELYKKYPVK
jgi:hypothetical protein